MKSILSVVKLVPEQSFSFWGLVLAFFISVLSCSSYDDYYPASGVFCDLHKKERGCVELNLTNNTFQFENKSYPLMSLNRVSYETIIGNQKYSILMHAEHRIELVTPQGDSFMYHRVKKKR
jgi:hypothetical protein